MLSHRTQGAEYHEPSTRTTTSVAPMPVNRSRTTQSDNDSTSNTQRRSSSRRQHASSTPASQIVPPKSSRLPRSAASTSQARGYQGTTTGFSQTYAGRSPPLQALSFGTTTSQIPSLAISRAEQSSFTRTMSPVEYDGDNDTVFGVAIPRKPSGTYPPTDLPPRLIPELQALAASNSRLVNPASSSISSISSPSTCPSSRLTTSSPWSASTTATTPLSWTSASPRFMQATSASSKRANTLSISAAAPRGRQTARLPSLKEKLPSIVSSRSNADIDSDRGVRKIKKVKPPTPEPTPPPRSSSLRRNRSRSNSNTKSPNATQETTPVAAPMVPSLPAEPLPVIPQGITRTIEISTTRADVGHEHTRLQEALNISHHRSTSKGASRSRQDVTSEAILDPVRSRQLLEPLPIAQGQHRRFPSLSRRHARQPSSSEPESEKQSARSRLAKFSRMALFGRSSKEKTTSEDQPQKLQSRKGPVAGTGHEGYGKFGSKRARKQSFGSSAAASGSEASIASATRKPAERRTSRMSNTSQDQSDLDEFAATRLKPVVMVGGSQRGRTDPFPKTPQLSSTSLNTMSSTDSYPAYTRIASPRRERFPPDLDASLPTLAARRSQKFAESEESFRMPEPIDTSVLIATPALDSRNTTQSSEIQTPASAMYKVDPGLLEKQRGRSKKLKWNIFRRKESISENREAPIQPYPRSGLSVDLAPAPTRRAIPFYAPADSEDDFDGNNRIGQFLKEAQESPEREDELISIGFSDDDVTANQYTSRESILLPSAPLRAPQPMPSLTAAPQIVFPASRSNPYAPQAFPDAPAHRQPRLAQVGRIPKVVPTRQQAIPGLSAPETSAMTQEPATIEPKPSRDDLPRLTTQLPPLAYRSPSNFSRPRFEPRPTPPSDVYQIPEPEQEFLQYQSLRNSELTTSSGSTGIISIMEPPNLQEPFNFQSAEQSLHDDDVWHEYNDFMDDIMSPSQMTKSPMTQDSSKRSLRINTKQPRQNKDVRSKGLAILPPPSTIPTIKTSFETSPYALSSGPSLQELQSSEEIRLRRSRIAAALHASYAPSSPFSMRDFLDEYGRPASKVSDRHSGSSAPGVVPAAALTHPQREQSRTRQYENAAQLEEIERLQNPTKHSDRQYASLMVSRWLSFGRVLFSPAHQEIETNPRRHVLVVDGLGSEDWSIYCAVTYQAQEVFVHDLKERRGKNKKAVASSAGAPPNHRRSEVSNFNEKFPFPPGFFSVIVIRFPPAMPDSKLKNIISESRRVLAPGGFLELMVLDLDIVNMGVQTRRAIKELKIKLATADRSVSLKPIIDNVQTVLGSNGFSNLNRCVVGVPVVGKATGSVDSSSESRSSSGSGHTRRASAGPRPYGNLGSTANFSLNDLVADHSEHADAKIGRMVSRTARSWWQHCFEAGMMTGTSGKSILSNKEVLNECKTRAANFKLLIAYTQKPPFTTAEQKRRTMSEPNVATLATAGVDRAQI